MNELAGAATPRRPSWRPAAAPLARPIALGFAACALLLAACEAEAQVATPTAPTAAVAASSLRRIERTYVVRAGDHLAKIAAAHDVTLEELVELNEPLDPARIEVGQEIVLGFDEVRRRPARPLAVRSAAATQRGVLNQLPEWPLEMTRGESAIAFVGAAGVATAILLYAVYGAFSLAYEAVGARLPAELGSRRVRWPSALRWRPRRPASPETTEADATPSVLGRFARRSRRDIARWSAAAGGRLRIAATRARTDGWRLGRAGARRGWPRLRTGVARGSLLTFRAASGLARRLRPLGKSALGAARGATRGRRQAKLRKHLEEPAEVPLRLGLVDEAEQRFRRTLAECPNARAGRWRPRSACTAWPTSRRRAATAPRRSPSRTGQSRSSRRRVPVITSCEHRCAAMSSRSRTASSSGSPGICRVKLCRVVSGTTEAPRHAPPAAQGIAIAAHCFVAQLFLQSGAIVMVTAFALAIFGQPAGMLMAPIAAFYLFVGVYAVRLAGRAAAGHTPLL